MRKKNAVQTFLSILMLVTFLGTGYVTVSISTPRPAYAGSASCGQPCIVAAGPVSVQGAIATISTAIVAEITAAGAAVEAFYTAALVALEQAIVQFVQNLVNNIPDTIKTMWTETLHPAMRKETQQASTLDADQSRAITSMTDAQNLNRIRTEQQIEELESQRQQRLGGTVCQAASVTSGMTRAAVIQDAYAVAASTEQASRSANAEDTAAANGAGSDMRERFEDYKSRYCDETHNNGTAGCDTSALFSGKDLDVPATIFAKETIDLTDPDTKKTVDALIQNIAEPFPKEPVPAGAVNSAAGQEAVLDGEEHRAKRQVIFDSLNYVVARRAPGSNMAEFVGPIRAAAGVEASQISLNPSRNEVMQAMMVEKFRSGQFAQSQITEPENNQRELVTQEAYQLMQMSDQLDLLDHYALTLAAQTGAEIKAAKTRGTAIEGAPLR